MFNVFYSQTGTMSSIKFLSFLVVSVVLNNQAVESANIVFFFGISSYSHRVPAWPLAEALAEKGHNVTFISPYPAKSPNPKIFDYVPKSLKDWIDTWEDLEDVFQERKDGNLAKGWLSLPEFGAMMCEIIYDDKKFITWVKESEIDLVFIDSLFNECAYGMAHNWKAKTIAFATSTAFGWYPDSLGLPDESTWIPNMELFYPLEMTFAQRIKNALLPVAWHLVRKYQYFPRLEAITKEKLGITDLPKFEELEKNTSLVFLNTHYSEEFARSLPPNTISIGGIGWVEKRKPLPKDLENFLKKGDGFIYVSFGTYADFTKMSIETQQAMIGAMRNFPSIQFVWKVSNDSLIQEFPKNNVYIDKWMPQQEILSHPKIKAFVTHSGLLGIQEAVTCGVPLISFPIFAEQDYNAERIHRKEYGIRLEITTVKQQELEDAFKKILIDPKYRNNMKRISTLFKERPQKPLDLALWWTDYVLNHSEEELTALRPSSVKQPWWKRRQIDVWLTISGVLLTILGLSIYIVYKILGCIFLNSSNNGSYNLSSKKKIQ